MSTVSPVLLTLARNSAITMTMNDRLAVRGGDPKSVTVTPMPLVVPASVGPGVQENKARAGWPAGEKSAPKLTDADRTQINDVSKSMALNDRDRLLVQFRESAPEFYNEYQSARVIVNAPTGASAGAKTKVDTLLVATSVTKAA